MNEKSYTPQWPEEWDTMDLNCRTLSVTAMRRPSGDHYFGVTIEDDSIEGGFADFELSSLEAKLLAHHLIRNLDPKEA